MPGILRAKTAILCLLARYLIPHRVEWVQVQAGLAKGLWFQIDLATERNWWSGRHEPVTQDWLQQALDHQGVMYDVGAHLGRHSLPAARLGAHVVAFEPDPENAARLRAHVDRNGFQNNVQVVQAAVFSNTRASIIFRRGLPRSQGGLCRSNHLPALASGEIITVPALQLDDFVACGGPAPDVIKIDVEGAESEVLKGASRTLERHRPALIIEVIQVSKILHALDYQARWETPTEGYPRHCFATPAPAFLHSSFRLSQTSGSSGV
jgi:FkbM family methyltransferase